MATHCPVCKKKYGFFDKISSPSMCSDCHKQGARLPEEEFPSSETKPQQRTLSASTRYPALWSIAKIYKVLAYLFGIIAIVSVIIGLGSNNVSLAVISFIGGIVTVVTNLAIAEGIIIFLSIEENTRRTSRYVQEIAMSNNEAIDAHE